MTHSDVVPVGDRAFIVIDLFGFLLLLGTFGVSIYMDRHRKPRASVHRWQDVKITKLTAKPTNLDRNIQGTGDPASVNR